MKRIHDMPFGAQVRPDGVRFALWAPSAQKVDLVLDGADPLPMDEVGDGWRRLFAPGVGAGARYSFRIDGGALVPDPASRFQPQGPGAPSAVIDPGAFAWSDQSWRGRPWEEAVVWEAHVGAATPGGDYRDLEERLPRLVDLGVTAVELMPIADCPGSRNWGYDGVLPFAPHHAYGAPDDLKRLVARAHGLGLMMFLDVVYNHFGPSGNFLHAYAAAFFNEKRVTPWGAAINFDGPRRQAVRDYFIQNALYWLDEFRFDGLRFDAVHAFVDDSDPPFLAELAQRARAAFPERRVHLILENENNQARWLERAQDGRPRFYSAQWNDDLHHCWHRLLTDESEGYYQDFDQPARRLARALAEGFVYQGEASPHHGGEARGEPSAHLPPCAFVAFLQNHDQIGNRAFGERLTGLAAPERLALARAALLLAPQIPMLFMGEEWAAATPFLYFVDFADDPALSRAVRDGRRQEFAHFAAFSDPGQAERIPDPTLAETFTRSKLDWSDSETAAQAASLRETRDLLRLRKSRVTPLVASGFLGATHACSPDALVEVAWRFKAGVLRLAANLGDAPAAARRVAEETPLWSSPGAEVAPDRLRLGSWTAVFTTSPPNV